MVTVFVQNTQSSRALQGGGHIMRFEGDGDGDGDGDVDASRDPLFVSCFLLVVSRLAVTLYVSNTRLQCQVRRCKQTRAR